MKKILLLLIVYLLLSSHDMYLKMGTYHLEPDTPTSILLFNGTFDRSDNIITRDRMIDISLVGNGIRNAVDTSLWSEQNNTTILNFTSGEEGTWVAGVSTRTRNIELEADAFNDYLEHDGALDMLRFRKENNILDRKAIEKYSKHVKIIFQVGNKKTEDWKTHLGYPIEFVPISNPYNIQVGEELKLKLLWKGQPLANQLVYAGNTLTSHSHRNESIKDSAHSHEAENEGHHHHDTTQFRTNENGIIIININHAGQWYVRTIKMEESREAGLTHESNWATLTFEVLQDPNQKDHGHLHVDGTFHTHDNGDSSRMNNYLFILTIIILFAGIIWFIKSKQ